LFTQRRYRSLRHVVDAPEIRLELGPEVLVIAGLDGRHVGVPGVVDHDVETPEPFPGGRDRHRRGGCVGDIER
jgi:hypothetical protein